MVNGVDAGQVGRIDLVGAVCLEALEIRLVLNLANEVNVFLAPLVQGGHLGGRSHLLLGPGAAAAGI